MKQKLIVKCAVCGQRKDVSEMRNVDTVNGNAAGAWVYACRAENPSGLGGSCFGKYDRALHLFKTSV